VTKNLAGDTDPRQPATRGRRADGGVLTEGEDSSQDTSSSSSGGSSIDREAPTLTFGGGENAPGAPARSNGERSFSPDARPLRPGGPLSSAPPPNSGWVLEGATRYEIEQLIGAGGMGRVFKARDRRLGRHVALKFIRDNEPLLVERFLREAQAQARIEHENICKVYEAGEIDGYPYIAMQLIEGQSLKTLRGDLSIEQKVQIMRKVAEALHTAHRLGLIHRDVKPSNVMLERAEDGSFRPYVMDFGLARDIGANGNAMTEAAVGTPSFMAPEQVLGDVSRLDRCTDIHALGATLYYLLAGKPPFRGETTPDILLQVVSGEPIRLRAVDPQIPVDLETIVMRCLEKEPQHRYDSARAFADDLGRYLDGEPIQARPATFGYILRKKARKHRIFVLLAGFALTAAMVVGALWIRASVAAKRREALAEQLGQHVKEIELLLRSGSALPAHDMRREKAVIRAKMERIREVVARGGSGSEGPGPYALGRGHLALHEFEEARRYLEQAIAAGYARPEVHYTLGLSLGGLYQKGLDQALRIGDKGAREAKKREVEQTYLAPALDHLRASEGTAVESKTYIDGLVALYEKRYEAAAAKAVAAAEESPWLYEASKLEGDARFAAGTLAKEGGQKDQARRELDLAIAAYGRAADMARSDETIHEALAEAWIQILELNIWQGLASSAALSAALSACADALKANPESANAFSKRARAYYHVGYSELRRGEDPRPTLERAIESGREALRLAPEDAIALHSVGLAHLLIAKYERRIGRDPGTALEHATQRFETAIKFQPSFAWAWNDAGIAFKVKAETEIERGVDARPSLDRAIERFEHAAELDPSYTFAHANITSAQHVRATFELASGRDPRPAATRAIESSGRATRLDPAWFPAHLNKGLAQIVIAQFEDVTGGDPSAALDQADESFQTALRLNADEGYTHLGIGAAKHVRALHRMRTEADPGRSLDEGRAALQRSIELDGSEPETRLELGRLELTAARRAAALGQSPEPFLLAAKASLEQGLRLQAHNALLHAALAELHGLRAEEQRRRGAKVDEAVAQGLAAADKALERNPQMALATAAKGALYLELSRSLKGAEQQREARRAVALLEEAVAKDPLLQAEVNDRLNAARMLRGE
jgi:eukaryotic-like serine/threonine-protein kinase